MSEENKATDGNPNDNNDQEQVSPRRKISILNRLLTVMSAFYLATASFVAGDAIDPLNLGPQRAVAASVMTTTPQPTFIETAPEHDAVTQAQSRSTQDPDLPPPTCADEIRRDLIPETATVRFLQDANEQMPNFHAEYYVATTQARRFNYTCTVTIIPYDVHVVQTGSTAIGANGQASRRQ